MEQQIIEKPLGEFDSLELNSVFDVYLIQGTENSIKIEGAKKILENIDYTITNNTLTIINNYKGNWIHPKNNKIKLTITVNQISKISANETCNIKTVNTLISDEIGLILTSKLNEATLDIQCNTFYYWNNFPCGGRIKLSGTTNELKLWNVALMAIDAYELIANNVLIDNASKGDCKVNASQSLTYSIKGEGNIYVKGNPATIVKVEESSTGKLIVE
jgi:hypothetical protein